MLIKGEKWACEACIRGHRVSSCQHVDRPLTHINKKGRPVSQCPHCRGLRKSRTSHVRCQCGEKPHSKASCPKDNKDGPPNPKQCCCGHGARCTCAAKRDSNLDTVPEAGPPPSGRASAPLTSRRPLAASAKSESTLSGLTLRHNRNRYSSDATKRGQPYSIPPRHHTIESRSPLRSPLTRRSADQLPLRSPMSAVSEAKSLPWQDSITSAPLPARRAISEHGSPASTPERLENPVSRTPPLNIAIPTSNPTSGPGSSYSYTERSSDSYYSRDIESILDSAPLSAPHVDWSSFDFPLGSGNYTPNYSQPPSYASLDFSHPGLAYSSGDVSEVEDLSPNAPNSKPGARSHAQSVSDASEGDLYRVNSSPSFFQFTQGQVLSPTRIEQGDPLMKSATPITPADQEQLRLSMPVNFEGYPPTTTSNYTLPSVADMGFGRYGSSSPYPQERTYIASPSPDHVWSPSFPPAPTSVPTGDRPSGVWYP